MKGGIGWKLITLALNRDPWVISDVPVPFKDTENDEDNRLPFLSFQMSSSSRLIRDYDWFWTTYICLPAFQIFILRIEYFWRFTNQYALPYIENSEQSLTVRKMYIVNFRNSFLKSLLNIIKLVDYSNIQYLYLIFYLPPLNHVITSYI